MTLLCRAVVVAYDSHPVLRGLDLDVGSEEVLALLGPSGSGKTTLLYAVAGFLDLAGGTIAIAGREVAVPGRSFPPEDRDLGFVFQQYALWPHLDALATVAYPLRRRGVPAAVASARARELLERMGVGDLAHRRPAELSGGQQQRVGLARALAGSPKLYLFDEPTAHLDAALRASLQEELAMQRKASGAAAVYATHDAGEALAVADRVALLRDGLIMQFGSPRDVYERPVDLWAARLTGPAAVLRAEVVEVGEGTVTVRVGDRHQVLQGVVAAPGWCSLLVRPEWARLGGDLEGTVAQVWFRGPHTDYRVDTPGGSVEIRHPGPPASRPGERVGWTLERAWALEG